MFNACIQEVTGDVLCVSVRSVGGQSVCCCCVCRAKPDDPVVSTHPVLNAIGQRYNKTAAQVCIACLCTVLEDYDVMTYNCDMTWHGDNLFIPVHNNRLLEVILIS